jgi:hypothetical protein
VKISRRSWHYRWYMDFWNSQPTDLCSYFWKLVFSIVLRAGMILIGSTVVLAVGSAAVVGAYHIAGFLLSLIGIGAAVFFVGWLARRSWKARDPNIVVAYLRAKKERLCPLIEVED